MGVTLTFSTNTGLEQQQLILDKKQVRWRSFGSIWSTRNPQCQRKFELRLRTSHMGPKQFVDFGVSVAFWVTLASWNLEIYLALMEIMRQRVKQGKPFLCLTLHSLYCNSLKTDELILGTQVSLRS